MVRRLSLLNYRVFFNSRTFRWLNGPVRTREMSVQLQNLIIGQIA